MPITVYTATTPDRHTFIRSSRTVIYTHARWMLFKDNAHQTIVSWHVSKKNADKSPFQNAAWKNNPWGVVPVHPCTVNYGTWAQLGGAFAGTGSPEEYVRNVLNEAHAEDEHDLDGLCEAYRQEINNRLPDGLILYTDNRFLGDGAGRWGMHDLHAHLTAAELLALAPKFRRD